MDNKPMADEQARKKGRMFALTLTRVITAVILLAFIALAWYGAEMLLYGYSQPSVVKAIVAVWLVMAITGRLKKEMIINDERRETARRIIESVKKDTKD